MIIRLKLERAQLHIEKYLTLFDETYFIDKNSKTRNINKFFLHDIGERPDEMQGAVTYVELKTWPDECNCKDMAGSWYCEIHGHMR